MYIHRRSYFEIVFTGLVLGCSDNSLFHIQLEESASTEIEGTGVLGSAVELVGAIGFDGFAQMNFVSAEELQNQGVAPGDIETAEILELSLSVVSPPDGDLSFLESMDVYVSAPELESILVASFNAFEGEKTVYFDLEGENLMEYVVSESMTITTDVVGTAPEDTTVLEANVILDVGVTTQGACRAAKNN